VAYRGCFDKLISLCIEAIGFTVGLHPFRYLWVPIITNKVTKLECRTLVEKVPQK